MPLQRPSLIIGQLISSFRSDWQAIGENEDWKLEQSKSKAGSYRIVTQRRPFQLVATASSVAEAKENFELLVEIFLDVKITPISIFKTMDAYLKKEGVSTAAEVHDESALNDLKELQEAIENEEGKVLADDVASSSPLKAEGDDRNKELDQQRQSYGEMFLTWVTTSDNPIAKNIFLPLVDPFLPKPELTLMDEIKRGDQKKTIIFSGMATIYCIVVRYSSFDFFLLTMAGSYFLVYYLVTEWDTVVKKFREMQRKVAKKLVREKIKHRLGKFTTTTSCSKKTE